MTYLLLLVAVLASTRTKLALFIIAFHSRFNRCFFCSWASWFSISSIIVVCVIISWTHCGIRILTASVREKNRLISWTRSRRHVFVVIHSCNANKIIFSFSTSTRMSTCSSPPNSVQFVFGRKWFAAIFIASANWLEVIWILIRCRLCLIGVAFDQSSKRLK